MIIPFMRTGEWMIGSNPTALDDITRFTDGDFMVPSAATSCILSMM
jgi:hypothetical protein